MTRSRPGLPDRPLPIRLAVWVVRASASLELAVVLVVLCATVLAWGTIVESQNGAAVARFGIYGAWWFVLLNVLLALNVLAATVIRFPWKRRQSGFLLTHLGILVLLAGALVTFLGGVDSQLEIFEGEAARRAYLDTRHFALQIQPRQTGQSDSGEEPEPIRVPFRAGPFNWQDYEQMWWFPWRLARRSRGVIYDHDGITLEVLDYYTDSRRAPVPRIALRVDSDARAAERGARPAAAAPITLAVVADEGPHAAGRRFGMGEHQTTPQGDRIVFWMTGGRAETEAFLQGTPEAPLGKLGQVVLYHGGQVFRFRVDQWQQEPRQPLGDTGLEVELVRVNTVMLGVQLTVHSQDEPPQPMTLLATLPHMNRQDRRNDVYGSYWLDAETATPDEAQRGELGTELVRQAGRRRVDILLGHDQKLYWRAWRAPQIDGAGRWPADGADSTAEPGTTVVAFPRSQRPLRLTLDEFLPRREPDWEISPLPFKQPDRRRLVSQPRARVRLTVDGRSEEFWLAAPIRRSLPGERRQVASEDRRVSISLEHDFIELGFQVFLHKFSRKLDPGASSVSHYSSLVDFCDPEHEDRPLRENVLVSLNAPVSFTDPLSGRCYRLYQSSYAGPFGPDDPQFQQVVDGTRMRDRLFQTSLAVNSDPGRGLKYVGCLMICVGILATFYLRKRGARVSPSEQPSVESE